MLTGSRIEADKWQILVFFSNWENILSGIQAGCESRLWESQPAGQRKEGKTSVETPFPLNLFPKSSHWRLWKSLEPAAYILLGHFSHATVASKYSLSELKMSRRQSLTYSWCFWGHRSLALQIYLLAWRWYDEKSGCWYPAIICWSGPEWAVSAHDVDEIWWCVGKTLQLLCPRVCALVVRIILSCIWSLADTWCPCGRAGLLQSLWKRRVRNCFYLVHHMSAAPTPALVQPSGISFLLLGVGVGLCGTWEKETPAWCEQKQLACLSHPDVFLQGLV